MKRFVKSDFFKFIYRWIRPFGDPILFFSAFPKYAIFIKDWLRYSKMAGAEHIILINAWPSIHDKTQTTSFDKHYFYQDIWAFKKIYESKVKTHIDIGSRVDFVGFLTSITRVVFLDIRPLEINLKNFESINGNILSLPFKDNSLQSLSCLHVAEHIGLGRYGDSLDPLGTKKACQELSRVLAQNGNLYFSLPVGKPKVCFNAHRIHSPKQIIDYFNHLKLVEFSGIDDKGNFKENIDINSLENSNYACGLFWFKKV